MRFFLVFLLISSSVFAFEINEQQKHSVVFLHVYSGVHQSPSGDFFSAHGHGTAFFVKHSNNAYLVTAHHVVNGAKVNPWFVYKKHGYYTETNDWILSNSKDIAAIPISGVRSVVTHKSIEIDSENILSLAREVQFQDFTQSRRRPLYSQRIAGVYGYPGRMSDSSPVRFMKIAVLGLDKLITHDYEGKHIMTTDGVRPGMSGGPLVENGKVIGLTSAMIRLGLIRKTQGVFVPYYDIVEHLESIERSRYQMTLPVPEGELELNIDTMINKM